MKIFRFIKKLDKEIQRQLEAERVRFIREIMAEYTPFRPVIPEGPGLN